MRHAETVFLPRGSVDVNDEYISQELCFNGKQLHWLPKETGKKVQAKGKLKCDNSKAIRKLVSERGSGCLQVGS